MFLAVARGAFSIVKKAVLKSTKTVYAAKIINTKRLTARGNGDAMA